jgi:predicted RNA-binding Zn ribbon-like protein
MPNEPISAEDLPLLGEPFPVEIANTWYQTGAEVIDFLGDRDRVALWFAHATPAAPHQLPARLSNQLLANIREVRDAAHMLCVHMASRNRDAPLEALSVLNGHARLASGYRELQWSLEKTLKVKLVHTGKADDVLLASMASEAMSFFAGSDGPRVRRCATPVCELFFVQNHHRRRFCSEPCSQRSRQSRYYTSRQSSQ